MDIANLPVRTIAPDGDRRTVTMFEAAVMQLANGAVGRRRVPTAFIRLVLSTATPSKEAAPRFREVLPAWLLADRERVMQLAQAGPVADFDKAFANYVSLLHQLDAKFKAVG